MGEMIAELRRLKLSTDGSKEELQTRLRGLGAEKLQDFRERTMAARAEKGKLHCIKGKTKGKFKKQKVNQKTQLPISKEERKALDKKSKQARERRKQKRDKATQAKTRQY